jgi:type II secretory pathway predicted ATPase ExeA
MRQNEEILFRDWHWSECLERLDNVVLHSDSIILVSGVTDSGKTTLKQELINILGTSFKIFSMCGEQRIGVTTLMRQVTLGFGLPWDNNLSPDWGGIQRAIFSQPNCRWVLLIDDAEKLSWDALNALIRLYTTVGSEGSQFSLILFADISLEDSLRNSVLKDFFENKFQTINLKPLSFDQMVAFLHSIELTFEHRTLKKIYNASNGIIGKIKQLAISELNIKGTEHNMVFKKLLENIINPPVIRMAVCCSLLVMAYGLFSFVQKKSSWQMVGLEKVVEQPKLDPVKEISSVDVATTIDSLQPQQLVQQQLVQPIKDIDLQNIQSVQYEELYQRLYADLKTSLQEHIQSELSKVESNQLDNIGKLENKLEQKIAELKLPIETKPIVARTINTVQAVKTETIEKNLLGIAKNRYTLQLMASKNEQTVKKLINNYPALTSKAKYFSAKFRPQQEDTWFVVVHGSYSNKELAMHDIKNLPIEIQNLKPIVRNYGSIHQLINNKLEYKK